MTKECTLSIVKLPLEGLPRNSVVRINDYPNMISAVYSGLKATNQTKFNKVKLYSVAKQAGLCLTVMRKPVFKVSNTNRAVQPYKVARGLKFRI